MTIREIIKFILFILLVVIILRVLGLAQATPVSASTYTVDSTGDDGDLLPGDDLCISTEIACTLCCTLRAAMEEANEHAGADTIAFGISGAGPHTITLGSVLLSILDNGDATTLDGTTQSGTACGDIRIGQTLTLPTWKIIIDANNIEFGGLDFSGSVGAVVKGIRIINVGGQTTLAYGVRLGTDGVAQCNRVGEGSWGGIVSSGDGALIGGASAGHGNIATGGGKGGITVLDTNSTVQGNFAGTADGVNALGNQSGIYVESGSGHLIKENVASGNTAYGIEVKSTGVTSVTIEDNYVGAAHDGSFTLCNETADLKDDSEIGTYADNTVCPPPALIYDGCCTLGGPGTNGPGATCVDVAAADDFLSLPLASQANCEAIELALGGDGVVPNSYIATGACVGGLSGTCTAESVVATHRISAMRRCVSARLASRGR